MSVSLPNLQLALPAYYILAPAEAASNLARYDGMRYGRNQFVGDSDKSSAATASSTAPSGPPSIPLKEYYSTNRSKGFGDEVQKRILIGTFGLSSE